MHKVRVVAVIERVSLSVGDRRSPMTIFVVDGSLFSTHVGAKRMMAL